MSDNSRRRNIILVVLLLVIIVIILLLTQCRDKKPVTPAPDTGGAPAQPEATTGGTTPAGTQPDELLSPAALTIPPQVGAGASFKVDWTGPNNRDDFVTIVHADAPADKHGDYRQVAEGPSLSLTAPIEPGAYEVRYVTGRSNTILGRAAITVTPTAATVDAPAEVVLGAQFSITWTGPGNKGDYITIVPQGAADDHYGDFAETSKGSPLTLTAPVTTGDAEVRYVAAQGRKVLARRSIRVTMAQVTLTAPEEIVAGAVIEVDWKGPNNTGDYITAVPKSMPDGQYGNYTNTATGSPLKVLAPIAPGDAELRYMTGQGNKVLARRAIKVIAAKVTLEAPAKTPAGTDVAVTWTGPNNRGDYITIVPKSMPDGQYAAYQNTTAGSPLKVKAPKQPGEAEIRYMSGQGAKVLARISITVE